MKILYVAGRWDPRDHNQASGTDYEITQALMKHGADVDIVGPFLYQFAKPIKFFRAIHRKLFRRVLFKYSISYFIKSAIKINRQIKKQNYDILISLYSAPLLLTRINLPFLYICDATIQWVKKFWKNRAWISYKTIYLWESIVINKSSHIITFSDSNADSLHNDYQVNKNKINIFPIPASIPEEKIIKRKETKKDLSKINLLLVGKNYHRKGIDLAIETQKILSSKGYQVELRIVGTTGTSQTGIKFLGYFNKTIPEDLNTYIEQYQWADFLLHPARFEAAGIVPSEAAAFGVPTITNDTGGLSTTVKDGISGVVLPKSSPPIEYVETIIDFVENPNKYHSLSKSTKSRYEEELNWEVLGNEIFSIAQSLISNPKDQN